MKITIDPNRPVPADRQIVQAIADRVRKGRLAPGAALPPEAKLAQTLGLAVAAVRNAYRLLVRDKLAEAGPDGGYVVSARQNVVSPGRKERAVVLIDHMLGKLKRMKFSYREIRALIDLRIMEKEERLENFAVAGIDCTPESLSVLERQIGSLTRAAVVRFLLDDLRTRPAPEQQLEQFDLILTTPSHLDEMKTLAPRLKDRILPVVISPDQGTIMELAGLNTALRTGIVCESENFLRLVRDKLKDIGLPAARISSLFVGDEANLPDFLNNTDVVLVPAGVALLKRRDHAAAMQAFRQRGGKIVSLNYQIERGSLLLVEDRMRELLNG